MQLPSIDLSLYLRNTISLFNLILLLWLGLTILLNADRRNIWVRLVGAAFLIGAGFFASHSALLSIGLETTNTSDWWFFIGVITAVILPVVWYLIVLWYSGYWVSAESSLRQRQQPALTFIICILIFAIFALLAKPLRCYPVFNQIDDLMNYEFLAIPIDALGYMVYLVCIISLSLDAVRMPAPSNLPMGEVARSRARPWIIGAAIAFMLTAISVVIALFWLIRNTFRGSYYALDQNALQMIDRFDLVILCFIAMTILMIGQAIASYELFTGKSLPRRGLQQTWRRTVLFAAAFSAIIAIFITLDFVLIYSVLLTIILMTLFLALFGWSSYAEWERYIGLLRPFVKSEYLYDALLVSDNGVLPDANNPFDTLCRDVLNCQTAFLIATGSYGALVNDLAYGAPQDAIPDIDQLLPMIGQPTQPYVTISAEMLSNNTDLLNAPITYAIPLWSQRGLIGVLLLGDKDNGSLYTQEEIEIARITGERLIDTQAGIVLSRRLMQLQRDRMTQTLLVDQQSRRVLHDEVLPLIQTSMISLTADNRDQSIALLADAHKQISTLLHALPSVVTPDVERLGIIAALKRVIAIEFVNAFDHITWQVDQDAESALEALNPMAAETIFYAARELIRNAAKYARQHKRALTLTISAEIQHPDIALTIHDNGGGLAEPSPQPGHGIEIHSTMMAVIGGSLSVQSRRGQYTQATLLIPPA